MNSNELDERIAKWEDTSTEFKRCGGKPERDFYETVCAFANHLGGTVFLGVTEDRQVVGVAKRSVLDIQRNVANVVRDASVFDPPVTVETEVVDHSGVPVIRVWVPMSPDVHRFKGVVYDRIADADIKVPSGPQVMQMYLRKSGHYTEQRIFPYMREEDLDLRLLDVVREKTAKASKDHPWATMGNEELLSVMGVRGRDLTTGDEGFNLAAALLFGKEATILSVCPAYKTDAVVRIEDVDRYDDRLTVTGNLIEARDLLVGFCERHLPDPFFLEGDQRKSLRSVIVRELVGNILIHREFTNPFTATITVDRKGLRTENASRTVYEGLVTPTAFKPLPKNPIIARVFKQIGYADELGSGVRNLFKYSKHFMGADPILEEGHVFRAFVPDARGRRNEMGKSARAQVAETRGLGKLDKSILSLAKSRDISVVDVVAHEGVSRATAYRHLSSLAGQGFLTTEGSTRNRVYRIAGPVEEK